MPAVKFSQELVRGIQHVNNDVAHEIEYETRSEKEQLLILAETCLDAGRLETWGHPEAQRELRELIQVHGWPVVLDEAVKHVSLY